MISSWPSDRSFFRRSQRGTRRYMRAEYNCDHRLPCRGQRVGAAPRTNCPFFRLRQTRLCNQRVDLVSPPVTAWNPQCDESKRERFTLKEEKTRDADSRAGAEHLKWMSELKGNTSRLRRWISDGLFEGWTHQSFTLTSLFFGAGQQTWTWLIVSTRLS